MHLKTSKKDEKCEKNKVDKENKVSFMINRIEDNLSRGENTDGEPSTPLEKQSRRRERGLETTPPSTEKVPKQQKLITHFF